MVERILSTKGLVCIIVIVWLFNNCILKVKYTSLNSVFKNYLDCFKDERGKMLIIPLTNYLVLPILLAFVVTREKTINSNIIEIITIIVSILTSMLFTLLSVIIEMKAKVKENPNYYSIEARASKKALIETYYVVMFEITISVFVLILCLVNTFINSFDHIQSFLIYSCSFILICNLLTIVKRIFIVIDTDICK